MKRLVLTLVATATSLSITGCSSSGSCDYSTPGAQPGSAQDLRDQQHAAAGDGRCVPG